MRGAAPARWQPNSFDHPGFCCVPATGVAVAQRDPEGLAATLTGSGPYQATHPGEK
jgi:hypothetical protein